MQIQYNKCEIATVNSKSKLGNCFQCAITVALKIAQIRKNPQRIKNICPFIDWCDGKNINFPSQVQANNKSIAVNVIQLMN